MSPIAVITVAAAAAVVAIATAVEREEGGRLSVREARAEADPLQPDHLRIYLTLVNEGGDDAVIALETPLAAEVALSGPGAQPAGDDGIAMPADSMLALAPDARFILARGVDWERLSETGFPLVLEFARSDAIYVAVPVAGADTP